VPTSIISNSVKDGNGNPVVGCMVAVDIIPGPAFRFSDNSEVIAPAPIKTDATGSWSMVLEENANIDPATSYYRVREYAPKSKGGTKTWYFNVPAADSPLHTVLIQPNVASDSLSGPTIVTSTTRPIGTTGAMIFESDTGKVLFYYGSTLGWLPDWGTAWGEVPNGYFEKTSGPFATSSTSYVDATGFTMQFNAIMGRRYETEVQLDGDAATTNSNCWLQLHDGTAALLERMIGHSNVPWTDPFVILHRSAGNETGLRTRKLQVKVTTGTTVFTLHAANPEKAIMVVRDTGPAAAPVIT
jgi:hypothetical protein